MKAIRRLRRAVRLLHHQRRALLREVVVNRRRLREAHAHAHARPVKKGGAMKTRFQAGDKVVLAVALGSSLTVVPQLVPGRVYCVRSVQVEYVELFGRNDERICLVGVRRDRRLKYIKDDGLPANYFRPVGPACQDRQAKGGA